MRILLFVFIGLVLMTANIWYVASIWKQFFHRSVPEVIAPFRYIGVEDKDEARGRAMAQMLAARLTSLQQEVDEAVSALEQVEAPKDREASGGAVPPSPDPIQPIRLNARVIEIPKLELKVSGVEVTGLLSWIYRGIAESRAINVIVYSPATAKTYTVAVHLDTQGLSDLWVTDIQPDDVSVVEEIALDILRQHAVQNSKLKDAAGLDRKEFRNLIVALRHSASLNYRLNHGVKPILSEYQAIASELEPLIDRKPEWNALLEMGALAAENGRDLNKALKFSRLQFALFKADELLTADQKKEKKRIEERITKLEVALKPPSDPAVKTTNILPDYPLSQIATPRTAVNDSGIRIAILGGTPLSRHIKALGSRVEMGKSEFESDKFMGEHTGDVGIVVRGVAPNATLLFTPMRSFNGTSSDTDILNALEQSVASKPKVLLFPLRLPRGSEDMWAQVLSRIVDETLVVLPAGNAGKDSPAQFDDKDFANRLMVVDAVDAAGNYAVFASRSEKVLWAPGVSIPITVEDAKGNVVTQTMDGTSFSAALAAGVAARVFEESPDLTPAKVIDLLRRTSKPLKPEGPKVIQLEDALKALKK
jgi:hypothetical protein